MSKLDITLPALSEHQMQAQCVQWFSWKYPRYHQLLFAIPNGGHRNKAAAGKAKAEGVKPGVAYMFLSVPKLALSSSLSMMVNTGGHVTRMPVTVIHGLYIEMKTKNGRQSPEQIQFQQAVEALGYQYEICRSLEYFQKTINEYLGTTPLA